MQIKKVLNTVLSKVFRKAPLPKLSKSGYSAMMTDEEAVEIITGKIYANGDGIIGEGCKVTAGGYTVIFPMSRDNFEKMLKEEGIIRYGCLDVNKLIEFLEYSSGTNVLDDWRYGG